jgi:hypothetical protein
MTIEDCIRLTRTNGENTTNAMRGRLPAEASKPKIRGDVSVMAMMRFYTKMYDEN